MNNHKLHFYPLGNADTTLIKLKNGKTILWDFANMKSLNDDEDKRCDLPTLLNKEVDGDFDVVTFTHADNDHIKGFSEYFYLQHAEKYQGEDRKKIDVLWVPAHVLLDTHADLEAKTLKAEARYRLKNKKGIRVFSRPKKMKDWCDQHDDISYEEVKHLFVDAGKIVPDVSLKEDGVEFFVHAPFQSDSQGLNRNDACIIVQATFDDSCNTKIIFGADTTHKVWHDIIKVSKHFKNADRLEWDFFHISHHCSYLSLNSEKGTEKTIPIDDIKWLFETQGHKNCRIISSSKPIPSKDSNEDKDSNPPHRQAANYYKQVASNKGGEFLVTMEHPENSSPECIVVTINQQNCAKIEKKTKSIIKTMSSDPLRRAGN